ncbi:hypothetical protein [Paraburkholderia nodosa]|uniref:hypothetical protein n=1 Tax=Paraburkholderia nodosa TaxID=392320 RepID=UPI000485A8C6|nr:hypothetical protein [Paraburkholderia nodosa]
MRDDNSGDERETLALVRLAWPQLVTMFGFLFAVLLRYPMWFVALSVLAVTISISHVAINIARNPARPFDFKVIDGLVVGLGWAASLLSMHWLHIEQTQRLKPGALLGQAIQTIPFSTPQLAWDSAVAQWLFCFAALIAMLTWAYSGRYLD